MRLWLTLGGLNGFMAVGAGAYGWHGLGGDPMFMMAAEYQLAHALALLGVAWLATVATGRRALLVRLTGAAFVLGILLFSGTLYALALTATVPVAGAAPVGGFLLMAGWLLLAVTGVMHARGS
ncbi:MAG: DUF423 domain-containing protein [Rhodospirillales bacterium]|nr:MAG: DUF423 domain-containing protein [Rhodospirillales bacterium]